MKKLQKKQLAFNGVITIFFSLVFVLMLSLVGTLIQSASIQTSKSIRRADMSRALENIFAEYQVEIFEKYDLFVREGSSEPEISERLEFYGIAETTQKIMKSTLLSDSNGFAFYKQAVACMGGTAEILDIPIENEFKSQEEDNSKRLEKLLQIEGEKVSPENSSIEAIKILKSINLLTLIYPYPEQLSNQNVQLENLASHRMLSTGVGHKSEQAEKSLVNKFLFATYLTEHFSNALSISKENPLAYEVEYLLGGKSSDRENLKTVTDKLISVRSAVNYAYLLTDQTKQMEAEIAAIGISSLMTSPEATEVVKQAILFAWAYGESILDVRGLLKGKKVPLVKSMETWQLQLSNLIYLVSGGEPPGEINFTEGVTYEEYVKVFLTAEDIETLSMRSLDLIELNTGMQADDCITQLEIESMCQLQRGITYKFNTNYEYE